MLKLLVNYSTPSLGPIQTTVAYMLMKPVNESYTKLAVVALHGLSIT